MEVEAETEVEVFDFDAEFQSKIIAMMLRDEAFMARTEGLVLPGYFDSGAQGYLADLTNRHYQKYRQTPSLPVVITELKDRKAKGLIKSELLDDVKEELKAAFGEADLSNRDFTVEQVAKFAQRRALEAAILQAADKLDKGATAEELRPIMTQALEVGAVDGGGGFDFFEALEDRTSTRIDILSGKIEKKGVTTGFAKLDSELYNDGWGIGELSLLMGGPKAGKSIGLMNFAVNGVLAGKNVLFVTLEVSKAIQADRMDSFISGVRMKDLAANAVAVKSAVKAKTPKAGGSLKVHEFPNASFRVSDLRRLVRRYEAQGVKFDLVVVDYADIMRPEDDKLRGEIEGYKQIYMGLRGLAQEEGFAVLSATQTNRGGAKAQTAGKTDVAEDFNKIRLADIVLSINRDDTDKDAGRMRLHFAAHRNGEEGHSLMCNTDLSKMRLIEDITGIAA